MGSFNELLRLVLLLVIVVPGSIVTLSLSVFFLYSVFTQHGRTDRPGRGQ